MTIVLGVFGMIPKHFGASFDTDIPARLRLIDDFPVRIRINAEVVIALHCGRK
jgi:hypothetical protein